MSVLDKIISRGLQNWLRAVHPFRPSSLYAAAFLAVIAGVGAYYQYNPPYKLEDMPITKFADQTRIMAAAERPLLSDNKAAAAFDRLWRSIERLQRTDGRSEDTLRALTEMAAFAAIFAKIQGSDAAKNLAAIARDRTVHSGLPPQSLLNRIDILEKAGR